MRRSLLAAAFSVLLVTAALRYFDGAAAHGALPIAGKPHIAQWFDDAHAAVSFTFDDGLQSHADIAAPMLHQFGFRGTFYIVAGLVRQLKSDPPLPSRASQHFRYGEAAISWQEVRQIRDLGMEIGNHSLTHIFLNHIPDDSSLDLQINHAADLITQNVGRPPLTFAFPYNEFTPRCKKMALQRHLAIRENWTDYGGPAFTTQSANDLLDHAIRSHSWLVPMIHGIDGGFLPLSSTVLRQHLAYLQHHPEVWVDTYADVARYQLERNAATLHVEESQPGELTFSVTDTQGAKPLTNNASPVPLTVILPLPLNENTDDVDAHLADSDTPVPLTREPDRILVNLPPNPTPVIVTWH
jgi:peptidoglycan/xylan/chitin deacetylase (PgdA/CDA1 family)